jgi:hypothetical protein
MAFLNIGRGAQLREEAGENGAEGGGGGAAQKALTEEAVGAIVNSAVTSQMRRMLGPAIAEAIGGLKLEDRIAALIPKQPQGGDSGQGDEGAPGTRGQISTKELQKQLTTLQEKLELEQKARAAAEQQRTEIEQKSRNDSARNAFRGHLAPKVKPDVLDVVVDYFSQRFLRLDAAGNPTLTVKRAPYKGAPLTDEDLPLAEAIPFFLESEHIKPFLPAPGGDLENGRNGARRTPRVGSSQGGDKLSALQDSLGSKGMSLDDLFQS